MLVKFLTWNILQGGGTRISAISEAIAKHKPDAVVLPEFRRGASGEQLQKGLFDFGLTHQITSNAPLGTNAVLIASRFEGTDAAIEIPFELQNHVAGTRIGDVNIIGTFCATDVVGKSFLNFLSAFENGSRYKMMLVTGDFYFGPRGSNPRNYFKLKPLLDAGWIDVWKRDNLDDNVWCCRSSRGGVSRPDHIFTTLDLAARVKNASYSQSELEAGLSDHAPLLADVEIFL
jgi:exonuclease III